MDKQTGRDPGCWMVKETIEKVNRLIDRLVNVAEGGGPARAPQFCSAVCLHLGANVGTNFHQELQKNSNSLSEN